MGVDAAVIGNHEFDSGAANFTKQARDQAHFPVLAANYFWEDWRQAQQQPDPALHQPLHHQERRRPAGGHHRPGQHRLAQLHRRAGNSLQVIPLEQNEVLRSYVSSCARSVDLIIIVSHAGLTEDQELIGGYEAYYEWGLAKHFVNRRASTASPARWPGRCSSGSAPENDDASVVRVKVAGVEGIDAILGGHLHIVLNPPQHADRPGGPQGHLEPRRRLLEVRHPPRHGDPDAGRRAQTCTTAARSSASTSRSSPSTRCGAARRCTTTTRSQFWSPGEFVTRPGESRAGIAECKT